MAVQAHACLQAQRVTSTETDELDVRECQHLTRNLFDGSVGDGNLYAHIRHHILHYGMYIYTYQCVVSYLIAVFASVTRALSVAISACNLDGLAGHELQRGNVVGGQLGEHSLGGGTLY